MPGSKFSYVIKEKENTTELLHMKSKFLRFLLMKNFLRSKSIHFLHFYHFLQNSDLVCARVKDFLCYIRKGEYNRATTYEVEISAFFAHEILVRNQKHPFFAFLQFFAELRHGMCQVQSFLKICKKRRIQQSY